MSLESVKNYLKRFNLADKILEFKSSSATVKLAAEAVGVEEAKIAKSLTFLVNNDPIMIVCAGDMKIDNSKYKLEFKTKAKMISAEEVENLIGHKIGGVCPFAIKDNVKVFLDVSLKRFDIVYPACGGSNNAIGLKVDQLEKVCQNFLGFVDVCKQIES